MFNFKREVLVDIKNDDTTLNYQESLVLDQRYRAYDRVGAANARLDQKAVGYLQAGGVVIGLVTVFNLFDSSRIEDISICLLIVVMSFILKELRKLISFRSITFLDILKEQKRR